MPLALDAVVTRALAAAPGARYPSGTAMAMALEPILGVVDPTSATTIVDRSGWETGSAVTQSASPGARRAIDPRHGNRRAGRQARSDTGRIGRLLAIGVVLLVAAVLALGAIPAFGDVGDEASASPFPVASATLVARVTPEPTAEPTPTPTPTPSPTLEPTPLTTPEPPPVDAGEVAALCDPFFEIPCALGPGLYAPMRFEPEIFFKLGEGWSAATNDQRLVVLARDEGFITLASHVDVPDAREKDEASARKLIDAIARLDDLSATKPAQVRIDKLRGRSIDVEASGSDRVEIFTAGGQAYVVERDRPTRVVALDVDGEVLLIVIEPAGGRTLDSILETADDVAASVRRR